MTDIAPEVMERIRMAVEDELVHRRDCRIGMLRNNGLCIRERGGTESGIVRMTIEECVSMALDIITLEGILPAGKQPAPSIQPCPNPTTQDGASNGPSSIPPSCFHGGETHMKPTGTNQGYGFARACSRCGDFL